MWKRWSRAEIAGQSSLETDEAVSAQEQYPDTPYWKMAARFGQLELEAHLRWGEETLAELRKIAKQEQSQSESGKGKSHAGK